MDLIILSTLLLAVVFSFGFLLGLLVGERK